MSIFTLFGLLPLRVLIPIFAPPLLLAVTVGMWGEVVGMAINGAPEEPENSLTDARDRALSLTGVTAAAFAAFGLFIVLDNGRLRRTPHGQRLHSERRTARRHERERRREWRLMGNRRDNGDARGVAYLALFMLAPVSAWGVFMGY